jgi:hypothetical protein
MAVWLCSIFVKLSSRAKTSLPQKKTGSTKSSAMVVPQLAAAYFARQGRSSLPPVEEIGAR